MAEVHGTGSIVRLEDKPRSRCRKWRLVLDFGRDPATKKRRIKKRRFAGTYTEAKAALDDFRYECGTLSLDSMYDTFAQYADRWLQERIVTEEVSKGTIRKNSAHVKTLVNVFGNMQMRNITPDIVANAFISLRKGEATLSGEPMSGTTANSTWATLKMIMETAKRRGVVASNPCEGIKAPKKDTGEKSALTVDEMKRLVGKLTDGRPDSRRTCAFTIAMCGRRKEEVIPLLWDDFSQDEPSITVRHAMTQDSLEPADTKTEASRRKYPIHRALADHLIEWKNEQFKILARLGIEQTGQTPIFTNSVGGYIHPANYDKWWRRWRDENGFPDLNTHMFRHTFGTRLMAENVDLVTAKNLLGQKDSNMLLKVYAHPVDENMVEAVRTVGDSFL